MSNREVQLILSMRDQATAIWRNFEANISGGVKRMGSYFAQNWGTILAGGAAVFFMLNRAFEKVERISNKVSNALGRELGGSAQNAANQVKELSEMLKTIRGIADQALIRVGLAALGIGKSIAVFFASLVFWIAKPLSIVEEGLNKLGITNSKFFQNLSLNSGKLAYQLSKEATDAFKAAFAGSAELGLGFEDLRGKVNRLKGELDNMDPTTAAYIAKYREWKLASDALASAEEHARLVVTQGSKLRGQAIRLETRDYQALLQQSQATKLGWTDMYKDFADVMSNARRNGLQGKMVDDFKKVSMDMPEAFDEGWQTALAEVGQVSQSVAGDFYEYFRGNIEGVGGLIKGLVTSIADQFAQLMAQLAAQAMFAGILSLIFPGIPFSGFMKAGGGMGGLLFGGDGGSDVNISRRPSPSGGGVGNVTIYATDAKSFKTMLQDPDHRDALLETLNDAARKGRF
jgi:hypothetical protein